jgi:hypothetical protein
MPVLVLGALVAPRAHFSTSVLVCAANIKTVAGIASVDNLVAIERPELVGVAVERFQLHFAAVFYSMESIRQVSQATDISL